MAEATMTTGDESKVWGAAATITLPTYRPTAAVAARVGAKVVEPGYCLLCFDA